MTSLTRGEVMSSRTGGIGRRIVDEVQLEPGGVGGAVGPAEARGAQLDGGGIDQPDDGVALFAQIARHLPHQAQADIADTAAGRRAEASPRVLRHGARRSGW